MKIILISLCVLFLSAPQALSGPLKNKTLESQAQIIFQQLRCVVCEGQSLSGSDAVLAQEMRAIVREKLEQGDSPEAIYDYFTARYGDKVLMEPPIKGTTLVLWALPLLLLAIGSTILILQGKYKDSQKDS